MKDFQIVKGHGAGLFTLGMKKEDVEPTIQYYIDNDDLHPSTFIFEYDEENYVKYIHLVVENFKERYQCMFEGMDLFNTKAAALVEHLERISPYVNDDDSEQGYAYHFPRLGLMFWRRSAICEEDLETD